MRRKEMAILGSVGYSNKMILSILSKEVSIISLLSFVVGSGILLLLKKPLEIFLRFVDLPIQIQINLYLYIGLFIVIVFMMMMNIILAKRSCRNINNALIEEIKR
jgi:ABC-type antimicrobial peptide transport system permease subunit